MLDGSLSKTIQAILEEQKPEAVYFVAEGGKRTGYLFLDLKSTADIPGIAEPWFLAFNASIEATPAMTPQICRRWTGHRGGGQEVWIDRQGCNRPLVPPDPSSCVGRIVSMAPTHLAHNTRCPTARDNSRQVPIRPQAGFLGTRIPVSGNPRFAGPMLCAD